MDISTFFGVADEPYIEYGFKTDQQQNVIEVTMQELMDLIHEERKINLDIIWNAARDREWYLPYKWQPIAPGSLHYVKQQCFFPGGNKWHETCKVKYGKQLDTFMNTEFAEICHRRLTEEYKDTELVLAENVIGRTIPATKYDIEKFNLKEISIETAEKKLDQERSNGIVTMPDGRMYKKDFFDDWEKKARELVEITKTQKEFKELKYVNFYVGYILTRSMHWAIDEYLNKQPYWFNVHAEESLRKHLRVKRVEKELKKLYNWDEKDILVYVVNPSGIVEKMPVRDKSNCANEYLWARLRLQEMLQNIIENEYANESRLGYRVYPPIFTAQVSDDAQFSDSLSVEEK